MIDRPQPVSERQLLSLMSALSSRVLAPGAQRVYDLLIEGVDPLTDLFDSSNAARAYQIWASISDLVDAPGGPQSDEACATVARDAAREWLAVDQGSQESIDAYFHRWLALVGQRG